MLQGSMAIQQCEGKATPVLNSLTATDVQDIDLLESLV
jgi:hypothetical protein